MAVTDEAGIIYYRYIYDTYGELSDITTDDGVSLKSSEQLTEYRLAELAHATGIDYLYNGQYGVKTDANGLYYMRARYYDQDIKRFINRDVVSGDISNSQSLNRYCYVQGNPVSLTDPFGLCPDPNSNFKNFCKFLYYTDWSAIGHAALDVAGLFWDGADVINALWYALEGNPEMAIASAIFAIPGAGIGIGNLMMKSEKLASAGKAVRAVSKFTQSAIGVGAGMSIATVGYQNLRHSIEAGEFSLTDLATFIGGLTIAAISGKGLISSGKDFASLFDDVGKTSKAGKGYLTNSDVNSMPIGGNGGYLGDEFEYYMDLANRLDVSTPQNGAVFYSGPGNRARATKFANENGKYTLETTRGGRYLDSLNLYDKLSKEQADKIWRRMSERYAQNAKGNTYGFVNGSNASSIFNTVEYPTLLKNKEVTNVFTEIFEER